MAPRPEEAGTQAAGARGALWPPVPTPGRGAQLCRKGCAHARPAPRRRSEGLGWGRQVLAGRPRAPGSLALLLPGSKAPLAGPAVKGLRPGPPSPALPAASVCARGAGSVGASAPASCRGLVPVCGLRVLSCGGRLARFTRSCPWTFCSLLGPWCSPTRAQSGLAGGAVRAREPLLSCCRFHSPNPHFLSFAHCGLAVAYSLLICESS